MGLHFVNSILNDARLGQGVDIKFKDTWAGPTYELRILGSEIIIKGNRWHTKLIGAAGELCQRLLGYDAEDVFFTVFLMEQTTQGENMLYQEELKEAEELEEEAEDLEEDYIWESEPGSEEYLDDEEDLDDDVELD